MLSPQTLRNQISDLKKKDPDTYVIVFPHWGYNYKWRNYHQTANAHRMIKAMTPSCLSRVLAMPGPVGIAVNMTAEVTGSLTWISPS